MEFHVSKLKMLGLTLLALGFVILGIFLVDQESTKAAITGWLSIVFFGFCTMALVWQLLKKSTGASVIIDERGINDLRTKVGLIPWNEISSIWVGEVHSQKFLCVESDSGVERTPALAAKGNTLMGFPPVTIGFTGLRPGIEAAIKHIQSVQPSKFVMKTP